MAPVLQIELALEMIPKVVFGEIVIAQDVIKISPSCFRPLRLWVVPAAIC